MVEKCDNCMVPAPKFRCSACKNAQYCSTECQKSDWSKHKGLCNSNTAKDTDDNKSKMVKVVVANGTSAEQRSVTIDDLSTGFINCVVPTMLGVPLKVKQLSIQSEKPDQEFAIFLLVDPQSGLAAPRWQRNCGVLLFARSDNKDFTTNLYYDLYSYIFNLMDNYGDGEAENYEDFKRHYLNPIAFEKARARGL